jgi:hypothetical protein
MTNQIATIDKAIVAQAREQVKTEFGLIEFKAVRVGAKKTVTRTELGVAMSGNKTERQDYANHVALQQWTQAKLGAIAQELLRVFPKLESEIKARNAGVNSLVRENPELADKLKLINTTGVSKLDVMGMFALAQGMTGADKGEKAKLLAAGRAINEFELAVQAKAIELSTAATVTN